MNVKDVISPFAFSCWQFFGYGVFVVAWIFIWFAVFRFLIDVTAPRPRVASTQPKLARRHLPLRPARILAFPAHTYRRNQSWLS
jgi:hypothetical protein